MAKKVKLNPETADPGRAMQVAAASAEDLGFLFEQHDDTTATVHGGRKPVEGKVAATRARLDVTVQPDRIEIASRTNGAAFAGGAGVGFFTFRINHQYAKYAKRVKANAAQAGLT